MPQNMLGYIVNVLPKDPTVPSTYVSDIIAAGATTTIEYPAQYRAVAISVGIRNQDTVNACQFSVNGAVHVFSQVTPMFYNTEAQRFRTVSQ